MRRLQTQMVEKVGREMSKEKRCKDCTHYKICETIRKIRSVVENKLTIWVGGHLDHHLFTIELEKVINSKKGFVKENHINAVLYEIKYNRLKVEPLSIYNIFFDQVGDKVKSYDEV